MQKKTLRPYNVTKSIVKEVFFWFFRLWEEGAKRFVRASEKSWLSPCGCNSVQGNVLGSTISITLEGQHGLIVIT